MLRLIILEMVCEVCSRWDVLVEHKSFVEDYFFNSKIPARVVYRKNMRRNGFFENISKRRRVSGSERNKGVLKWKFLVQSDS